MSSLSHVFTEKLAYVDDTFPSCRISFASESIRCLQAGWVVSFILNFVI